MHKFTKSLEIPRDPCAWRAEYALSTQSGSNTYVCLYRGHALMLQTQPGQTGNSPQGPASTHAHQASQHHWDEAKPSTHQWKPVRVHVHKQAGDWQHSWPSLGQPSAALHLHCQEHVHHETSTSLHVWTQQSHVGVRSNPGEKPSVKLCSRLS